MSLSAHVRLALCVTLFVGAACQSPKEPSTAPAPLGGAPARNANPDARPCEGLEGCRAACEACADSCAEGARQACFDLGRATMESDSGFDIAAAAAAYTTACDHGHALACANLALQVQDGRGVPVDKARAAKLYASACDAGVGVGCFNRGLMHFGGVGVPVDEAEADRWFARAKERYEVSCAAGDLQWCMNLGVLYEGGHGVSVDAAKAHGIYTKACAEGHDDSCANAALMELHGEVESSGDPVGSLRAACERGSKLPCAVLGQLLVQGRFGIARDAAAALPLLDDACRHGQRFACGAAAGVLALGELVPPDPERAALFEERGCALGDSTACLLIGLQAQPQQPGADGDPARAAVYFERACNIGHAEGCMRLAAAFYLGIGVEVDQARSHALTEEACRLGLPDGCFQLIARGEDLPLPPAKRDQMRALACQQGLSMACAPVAP